MPRLTTAAIALSTFMVIGPSVLATGTASAETDNSCQPTGYSPSTVVLGLSPVTVNFTDTVVDPAGCENYDIRFDSLKIAGTDVKIDDTDVDSWTFKPADNVDKQGYHAASITVDADGYPGPNTGTFPFHLKLNTGWGNTFDATPEPVAAGANLTLKAKLSHADWAAGHYVGYGAQHVDIQFRPEGGTWAKVGQAVTTPHGYVSTTATAHKTGAWRLYFGGDKADGASYSNGDHVTVT